MLAPEPASLWRENVVAVVNLRRVLARNARSFILILLSGEDLTSFNINDRPNFIDEKKQK